MASLRQKCLLSVWDPQGILPHTEVFLRCGIHKAFLKQKSLLSVWDPQGFPHTKVSPQCGTHKASLRRLSFQCRNHRPLLSLSSVWNLACTRDRKEWAQQSALYQQSWDPEKVSSSESTFSRFFNKYDFWGWGAYLVVLRGYSKVSAWESLPAVHPATQNATFTQRAPLAFASSLRLG